MRRILILQAGSTDPAVRDRFGDYPAWFARLLAPRVEVRVVRPYQAPLPPLAPFHGVLMTGSPRNVTEPEPWMDDAAAYLVDAARTRPVLGVCFGHQLLARALGARVERNPRGREAGTTGVELTAAGGVDPLFAGMPQAFLVQQTHGDHVVDLPPEATLLARNDFSPIQAYALGKTVRCVQFHPEMDVLRSRALTEARLERLDLQSPGGSSAVLASLRASPWGERILSNWVEHFVGAGAAAA